MTNQSLPLTIPPGPKPVGFGRIPTGVTVVVVVAREPGGPPRDFQRITSSGGLSRVVIGDATLDPCNRPATSASMVSVSLDLSDQHIIDLNQAYGSIAVAQGGIRGVALCFPQVAGIAVGDWKFVQVTVGRVGAADSVEEINIPFLAIL